MPRPPRFPIIIGPTAGGKSDLAVDVALLLQQRGTSAEIITADSVQIYRGLDVGSAKPTEEERRGIRHHLIDIVEPADRFTVADWLAAARGAITEINRRGLTPIVAGGTHLYIKALLEGLFEGPPPDAALREQLRARGLPALREELERVDPAAAARIHPNDERRTIRALEVFHLTGTPISALQKQWDRSTPVYLETPCQEASDPREVHHDTPAREVPTPETPDIPSPPLSPLPSRGPESILIGLDWPTEILSRRINARIRSMMERGLLDEVRHLHTAGRLGPQAREALGYKQLIRHLEGEWTLDEAVEQTKRETRRFAKNQRTWLRRLRTTPGSLWIDCATTPRDQWPTIILNACGQRQAP